MRDQLATIHETGDTRSVQVQHRPVVVMTMTGVKSGKPREVPVMRVEHDGVYAAVASKGGAPKNPVWFSNLVANPDISLQDGTTTFPLRARLATAAEHDEWWPRCVAAYPPYADYQTKTDRKIPVLLLEPR
ncbi:MAG: nitroreductase family deazaflavin-dependent oxidoreductase [Actinomycetota bacterium]|nr:nitroreductase family deazaflavin-dependent oxidoreductase [Actinomycetota bacterium]